jgi:transcriptional regulator with XRE-family HTH domain
MSDLKSNLRKEFQDEDFRNIYAEESLNTYIATQIKVLREQQRLTQTELAQKTGMAQPRIAVLEDVNYSSWSINTLRRLAKAFGLRLSVRFETFSSLIPELETFGRPALERARFEDDRFFREAPSVSDSNLVGAEVFLQKKIALAQRADSTGNATGSFGVGSVSSNSGMAQAATGE